MSAPPHGIPYLNRAQLEVVPDAFVRLYAKAHNRVPAHIVATGSRTQILDALFEHAPGVRFDDFRWNAEPDEALLNKHKVPHWDGIPGLKAKVKRVYRGFKPSFHEMFKAAEAEPPQNVGGGAVRPDANVNDGGPAPAGHANVGRPEQANNQNSGAEIPPGRGLRRSYAFHIDFHNEFSTPIPAPDPTLNENDDSEDGDSELSPCANLQPVIEMNDQATTASDNALSLSGPEEQEEALIGDLQSRPHSVLSGHDGLDDQSLSNYLGHRRFASPQGPDLGFVPKEDLSDLRSALEESADATSGPDEPAAFDLFGYVDILAGSPGVHDRHRLRYNFSKALSTRYKLKRAFDAALDDSSQAIYDLAAIQDETLREEEELQELLDQALPMVRKRKEIIKKVIDDGYDGSQRMWEDEWDQEWIAQDQKVEDEVRKLARQRKARIKEEKEEEKRRAGFDKGKGPERPLKRSRDEEETRPGTVAPDGNPAPSPRQLKRARVEEASEDDSEEVPIRKLDKGKGRGRHEGWDLDKGKGPERPLKHSRNEEDSQPGSVDPPPSPRPSKRARVEDAPEDDSDEVPIRKLDKGKGRARPEDLEEAHPQTRPDAPLKPRRKFTPTDRRDTELSYVGAVEKEEEVVDDDDENTGTEESGGQGYVPGSGVQFPILRTGKLNEHDWDNELYQLLKYDRISEGRISQNQGWYDEALDSLQARDREQVSWLSYGRTFGNEGIPEKAMDWRTWDGILIQENPFAKKSAYEL